MASEKLTLDDPFSRVSLSYASSDMLIDFVPHISAWI